MIRTKIIYAFLILCAAAFFILFIDTMSLLILILTLVFPLVQYLFLLFTSKKITASIKSENSTALKDDETKIILDIANHSHFPVSCAYAVIEIQNTLTGEYQTLTTMMPVSANNIQTIKFSVSYNHCGRVIISLKNLKIYDYIKMFSKNLKPGATNEMLILPEKINISPMIETEIAALTDSDEFSKEKPGDDCSEIFDIREYIEGDKINRIHWKLTSKCDKLMLKEYSLPISNHLMILFEFSVDTSSNQAFNKTDAAIETVLALSEFLIKNGMTFRLCWYNSRTRLLQNDVISTNDDISAFINSLFNAGTYKDNFNAFIHHDIENANKMFSHVIYISSVINKELFHNISVMPNAYRKTFLYITDLTPVPEYFISAEDTHAIDIFYEKTKDDLKEIVI